MGDDHKRNNLKNFNTGSSTLPHLHQLPKIFKEIWRYIIKPHVRNIYFGFLHNFNKNINLFNIGEPYFSIRVSDGFLTSPHYFIKTIEGKGIIIK